MAKIKAKHLLISGHSWTTDKDWYNEIYEADKVTNVSYTGSGNKYIAESVMEKIISDDSITNVLVCWSGLIRIDFALPKVVRPSWNDIQTQGETEKSRYFTNTMAPYRDRTVKTQVDTEMVRLMYQEKDYASVKNQSLLQILNLQNFLKVKSIDAKFCFMYDYTNSDFDHNHLSGEASDDYFSTLGSVDKGHPLLNEFDRSMIMDPPGIDWGLKQPDDLFKDAVHFTKEGYTKWAQELAKTLEKSVG